MASVGAAQAAEISLSGFAEMGIFGGNGVAGVDPQFFTDVDVTFKGKGMTDGGVEFGMTVDLDEAACDVITTTTTVTETETPGNGADVNTATSTSSCNEHAMGNNAQDGGVTIYVSGTFGKLTMGDTDGAFDWAMTEVGGPAGSINDDHTAHAGFNGNSGFDGRNDGQIAAYEYSFADFAFAVSAEIDDNGAAAGGVNSVIYGVGAKYSMAMSGATLSLGLGYQGYTNASLWGVSATVDLDSGLWAGINYSSASGTALNPATQAGDHYGIGIGYKMDALAVGVNYGAFNRAGTANDVAGFGIAASYDLGGGMSLQAGYGWSDNAGAAVDTSTYSFGAKMSF
ncbi:MAG: porin [Paracoccaceae bacterium]